MATKGKVVFWNPCKGWGRVALENGKEWWFVHFSAITPQPRRGSDLTGTELVEVETGQGQKGPAVTSALTREEFERRNSQGTATIQVVGVVKSPARRYYVYRGRVSGMTCAYGDTGDRRYFEAEGFQVAGFPECQSPSEELETTSFFGDLLADVGPFQTLGEAISWMRKAQKCL